MSELKRLNDLVGFSPNTRHDAYRIFNGDVLYRSIGELHEKTDGLLLFRTFFFEPTSTRNTEMCAWRECNHQMPSCVKNGVKHVASQMLAGSFCWQQVARPSVVAALTKCVPNDSRKFTRNQDAVHVVKELWFAA